MKSILDKYVGYIVTVNATNPDKLESCGLKSINNNFFSIVTQKNLLMHFPYSRILSVVEPHEGENVNISSGFSQTPVRVVIHIEHMMIYNGAVRFGFQIPV